MDVTRRKALVATGAAVSLAGCTGYSPRGTDNSTDDNRNGNGNSGNVEYEIFQLGPSLAQPLWATVEDSTGFITVLEDKYDDIWMVENPDEINGLQSWVDETNFEDSSIVYVETAGPNTCYHTLDISDIGIENGEIIGTAKAVDTSDEKEGCGSAETHPSAFVRVTADDLPSNATFTVVNGWGDSSAVTTDGRYADPANLPGHVCPDSDSTKLKGLSCDNKSFQRLQGPKGDEAALGEAYNDEELTFAMRVHTTQALEKGSPRVGRSDEVRITMWNVSTNLQLTGNRHKWNLQVLTKDGWQDVRGTTDDDRIGYDDIAIEHRPGKGFEWTLEMTEKGIVADHEHEDRLEVCPDLQPGRYRFVYRGIVSGEPLAVEFDYTDSESSHQIEKDQYSSSRSR